MAEQDRRWERRDGREGGVYHGDTGEQGGGYGGRGPEIYSHQGGGGYHRPGFEGDADYQRNRDWAAGGPSDQRPNHRGRGPKGYRRSDERIREDISDRLADDPGIDASGIELTVRDGEVMLTGSVDSRDARRRAEQVTEAVSGVGHVQNDLRVLHGRDDAGASRR